MAEKKVKEKGASSKVIIIVLTGILVFSIGFSGYLFLTRNNNSESESKLPPAPGTPVSAKAESSGVYTAPYKYAMDEFLVNLADEGGKKYFKIKMTMGYDTKKTKDMLSELEEKNANVRDAVISVLRAKKSTDLVTQKNIDDLKQEILVKINPIFESGKAYNLYFTDILIQ